MPAERISLPDADLPSGSRSPEFRLESLGISLPTPVPPVASYVAVRRTGRNIFVSGQLPMVDGVLHAQGSVPSEVSVQVAAECARLCAINALAAVKAELGSLDHVTGVIRLGCFVACGPELTQHPEIANGASDLLVEVFGEPGRHARAAVGCPSLPRNAPVEIEFLFETAETSSNAATDA